MSPAACQVLLDLNLCRFNPVLSCCGVPLRCPAAVSCCGVLLWCPACCGVLLRCPLIFCLLMHGFPHWHICCSYSLLRKSSAFLFVLKHPQDMHSSIIHVLSMTHVLWCLPKALVFPTLPFSLLSLLLWIISRAFHWCPLMLAAG